MKKTSGVDARIILKWVLKKKVTGLLSFWGQDEGPRRWSRTSAGLHSLHAVVLNCLFPRTPDRVNHMSHVI